MQYLIKFVIFLLAIQFDRSSAYTEIVKQMLGEELRLKDSLSQGIENLLKCTAIHNDIIYNIPLVCDPTNIYCIIQNRCELSQFGVTFEHAGKWQLKSTLQLYYTDDLEFTTDFEVHVYQISEARPAKNFITEVGNEIIVFPQDVFENITNYTIIHYKNGRELKIYDLLKINETNSNIKVFDKFKIQFLVDEFTYGEWKILQYNGPYKMIQVDFVIFESKQEKFASERIQWDLGSSAVIRLFEKFMIRPKLYGNIKVTYCKIIYPNGQIKEIQYDYCTEKIDKVDITHEGTWEIHYIIDGIEPKQRKYHVEVIDPCEVKVTVNTTNSQIVHLLCTYHELLYSPFCFFTKPDGTVLNLQPGIGNAKYKYYGQGSLYPSENGTSPSDCGVTIVNPSNDDFGLWQCSFGRISNPYKAFIPLIDPRIINGTSAQRQISIVAKRYSNLTIECPKYAPLKYCRLYQIHDVGMHNPPLSYFGDNQNLTEGVCRIQFDHARFSHAGNWSCVLGIDGGDEINIIDAITVEITNSYIYSNKSIIEVSKDEQPILRFDLHPETNGIINYCRWKRPDGYGIHIKNSEQYSTSYGKRFCVLKINEYNVTNFGEWTCFANLLDDSYKTGSKEEEFEIITLVENKGLV